MKLLRELSGLIGLVAVVITLVNHLNTTFSTKESHNQLVKMVIKNSLEIKRVKSRIRGLGAISCGMAMDLKLPTARKECNNIITHNN